MKFPCREINGQNKMADDLIKFIPELLQCKTPMQNNLFFTKKKNLQEYLEKKPIKTKLSATIWISTERQNRSDHVKSSLETKKTTGVVLLIKIERKKKRPLNKKTPKSRTLVSKSMEAKSITAFIK